MRRRAAHADEGYHADRQHAAPAGALFLGAAAALAITGAATGAARAGECPADRVIANSDVANAATAPSGVTDTVLTAIDLAREPAAVQGRQLRLRRLVVQPGSVVPWHSHGNRPAIIYVAEGEIVEYASTCAVPIVHRAGESTAERAATSHWWKNTSDRPVVLLSAGLFPASDDAHVM